VFFRSKAKGEMRLDDNETRISRGARRCRQAWVHGSPHVEDLALPKSLKSGNFTLAKAVIRWMSAQIIWGMSD
jgi:hypothetical protein